MAWVRAGPLLVALQITRRPVVNNGRLVRQAAAMVPVKAHKAHKAHGSGIVAAALYRRKGVCNGVLMEDGTMLRFDYHLADQVAELLRPDVALSAEGDLRKTPVGPVLGVS